MVAVELDVECLERAAPFGGRSAPVGFRGFHFWGSVAPGDGTLEQWVDPIAGSQLFRQCPMPPGLWQITTTAVEYRRSAGEGILLPLSDNAYLEVPTGVTPFTRRSGMMQLEVSANDGVDQRLFQMDCNQSIVVVAQSVCINWWGPPGTQDVQGRVPQASPLTGFVCDSFIGVALSRIEEDPGNNSTAILTKHLFVPAGERASIPIPAYAESVTIYQEPTLGAAAVMWTQTLGDPNSASGFLSQAALPFLAGQRMTTQQMIMPNASHLWTDADLTVGGRFFTLAWVIRP